MRFRTLQRDSALRKSFLCTFHITAFFCDLYISLPILLRNNRRNGVLQNDKMGLRIMRPTPRHRPCYRFYDVYIPHTMFPRNDHSYDVLQNVRTGLRVTKPIPGHKLYGLILSLEAPNYWKNALKCAWMWKETFSAPIMSRSCFCIVPRMCI
jgi:hypothetical protein